MQLNSSNTTWQQDWSDEGVTIALLHEGAPLTGEQWIAARSSAGRVAERLGLAATATRLEFTHEELAQLGEFDAVQLGLPRYAEAWLHIRAEGRVDSPRFAISMQFEPLQYAHPWVSYQRQGALLQVGERRFRLNRAQIATMAEVEAIQAAGNDMAQRLKHYHALSLLLHAPHRTQVRASGFVPISLEPVSRAGSRALFVRDEQGCVVPARPIHDWAMAPGRRYYLQTA